MTPLAYSIRCLSFVYNFEAQHHLNMSITCWSVMMQIFFLRVDSSLVWVTWAEMIAASVANEGDLGGPVIPWSPDFITSLIVLEITVEFIHTQFQ